MSALLNIGLAVVTYDRPAHLADTLLALQRSLEMGPRIPVHIFQDAPGPRPSIQWRRTHAIAKAYTGGELIVRDERLHEVNVTRAVSDLLTRFDAAIVLEDDVRVAPDFLRFMVDCLQRYASHDDVFSVCAEQFEFPELAAQPERVLFARFFLRHGFGVWRRSWQLYDPECSGWPSLQLDAHRLAEFNLFGRAHLSDLLARVLQVQDFSYDIRWYYTLFEHGGFSVMPTRSLIFNTGYIGGAHFTWNPTAFGPLARLQWRLGLRNRLYQRFYRGHARRAGSACARRGAAVLEELQDYPPYELRGDQHRKYATLLKRYQPRRE